MMAVQKPGEKGYVLILTIVIVSLLTVSIAILANRSFFASALAYRRERKVQAYQLAESAALEGVWQVSQNPQFRKSTAENTTYLDQQTNGQTWYYRYTIDDPSPLTSDDTKLSIIGEGFVGNFQSTVTINVERATPTSDYAIVSWKETNN
jgi:type II secretory pathway pseudopilin PulG